MRKGTENSLKKKILLTILLIAAIAAVTIMFIILIGKKPKNTSLSGELLIKNPSTGNGDVYLLTSKRFCGYNIYDHNMIFLDNSPYVFSGHTSIEKFDLNSGINKSIYETRPQANGYYDTIEALVPIDENNILISVNGNIVLYNETRSSESVIISDAAEFDYNHGKQIIYYRQISTGSINSYDLNNKTVNTIATSGAYPKISKDNHYLAYKTGNGLVVTNLLNHTDRVGNFYVDYYSFSPDSVYLAIVKYEDHTLMPNHEIIAWDHKNNSVIKIMDKIPYGKISNIDWR